MGANEKVEATFHGPRRMCSRTDVHSEHSWDASDFKKLWCPGLREEFVDLRPGPIVSARFTHETPLQATVKPEPKPLGRVGQAILTIVSMAILAPFVGILWFWAVGVMESLVR